MSMKKEFEVFVVARYYPSWLAMVMKNRLGMVQQDGEVLQLNVRVGDFAINDVSSIRATDSGSTGTFEMVIVSASLCWMQIIMYYPTTYLIDMMVTFFRQQ